jgi:glycosyltransferase 2 family protein
MTVRKALGPALKILVTLLLLVLIFRSVDTSRIAHHLRDLETGRLILLVLLCWMGQLLCAQRWRLFAASLRMQGSYRSYAQMYLVGMLFNIGLPSLIGGDVVKAYILSRKTGKPLQSGLASVLQDRAAGLLSLIIYGGAAVLIRPITWRGIPLGAVYLVTWFGVTLALWLTWKGEAVYRHILVEEARSPWQKLVRIVADFHQALVTMRLGSGAILQIGCLSFLNSALVLWIFQQVAVAAGNAVSLISFSALFPLITLLTMLPISFSGIGIREWAYVEALALLGVPPDRALVVALSTSALVIVVNLGGVLFLPTVPSELRRVSLPDTDERR